MSLQDVHHHTMYFKYNKCSLELLGSFLKIKIKAEKTKKKPQKKPPHEIRDIILGSNIYGYLWYFFFHEPKGF